MTRRAATISIHVMSALALLGHLTSRLFEIIAILLSLRNMLFDALITNEIKKIPICFFLIIYYSIL